MSEAETSTRRYYAGVGSRETPVDVQRLMWRVAEVYARRGWILRSGAADGADLAFERGCNYAKGAKEIFLPMPGFNGRQAEADTGKGRVIISSPTEAAIKLAATYHPSWERCSATARLMHARNCHQVLGLRLNAPVEFVMCWTKGAAGGGGTGQAIRIARFMKIPVFDLADEQVRLKVERRVREL